MSYTIARTVTQDFEVTISEGDYIVLPYRWSPGAYAAKVTAFADDGVPGTAIVRLLVVGGRGECECDVEEVSLHAKDVLGVYTDALKALAAAEEA